MCLSYKYHRGILYGKNIAVRNNVLTNHMNTLCVLTHRYTNSHLSLLAYDAVLIVIESRIFRQAFFFFPHGS
jgi:hypothetical protein